MPAATAALYRFGTSGYRSNQADQFNKAVITQISNAIADYLVDEGPKQPNGQPKPILLGGDTREKTAEALPILAQVLSSRGLTVYQCVSDVATPLLAYAAANFEAVAKACGFESGPASGAVLLTASHNPWDYGGINFLTNAGAVAPSHITKRFEALQQAPTHASLGQAGQVLSFDPYPAYCAHLKNELNLDLEAIGRSGLQVAYDPLFATGREVFPALLREAGVEPTVLNATKERPASYTGMPEPSEDNLVGLAETVRALPGSLKLGFSNDGDADRFGVLDETGAFVTPNTVLALVLYHQCTHRLKRLGQPSQGLIIRSQSTSHQLDALAQQFGCTIKQTPVGYKYVAETFEQAEAEGQVIILGGEGSGGLSIGGHVPEKDGLLANLLIAELVATEQKPLSQLVQELESRLAAASGQAGSFAFRELTIHTEAKAEVINHLKTWASTGYTLAKVWQVDTAETERLGRALEAEYGTRDGVKLYLQNSASGEKGWLLARASGTEPLLRLYWETQGASTEAAEASKAQLQAELTALLTQENGIAEADIHVKT